ncbi:hypothetical protein [Streptomyces sioyaensis]
MALPTGLPIGGQEPRDERQPDEYQASRGGWYPPEPKPVPGQRE